MPFIKTYRQGLLLSVQLQPGAKRNEVIGLHGDRLKLKVKAPPVEGAANAALLDFLAEILGLRKNELEIISGETSRQKNILIRRQADTESFRQRLLQFNR